MEKATLKGKIILIVDDEQDVLDILKEEITEACGECYIDEANSFERGREYLASFTYDLVILDIMGVHGFDLLKDSAHRHFPTVMLTAHALTPDTLKRSIEMGARAFLPKEKMGEIVPFLEDVLQTEMAPGWKRLFEKLGGFFSGRFGADWQKGDETFWKEFHQKLESGQWIVIPKE